MSFPQIDTGSTEGGSMGSPGCSSTVLGVRDGVP